jgi:hypothetical protein
LLDIYLVSKIQSMKKQLTIALLVLSVVSKAQIGVGTTSPNSTLDVRGSMALNYRAFSSATSAGSTDNILVFTGTSAATLTLPDASTMTGRVYTVKSASSNSSVLTIATTSSQTIDGVSSWTLTQQNKSIILVSNGSNWYATAESLPGNSAGTAWLNGGNNVSSLQNIGTTSNFALPFITNNTEKMRLTTSGSLGIGTSTFDGTNPEKLLVDAGTTSSINVISGKGSIDNYLQLNIQNRSTGTSASSDVVATADNGNETTNYVDMGINGSGYTGGLMGAANDAYLYNSGQNFLIGTSTAGKVLAFLTGGSSQSTNERMRIGATGNVAIGTNTWDATFPEKVLIDAGTTTSIYPLSVKGSMNGWFRTQITNNSTGTSASSDFIAANSGGAFVNIGVNGTAYTGSGILAGASRAYLWTANGNDMVIGNGSANKYLAFFTGGNGTTNERVRISSVGDVAIGTTGWDATNPEQLLVDAGATTSYNVISGKGSINNYLQLNIQNRSTGTAASSDVVATADNGSETVNYIDMGMNSSTYSSGGVLGGANTAYLYSTGNDFVIGNSKDDKNLIFYTSTAATSTERMRVTGTGLVGIGNITPNSTLDVSGSIGNAITTITANLTLDATHHTVIITSGSPAVTLPAAASGNSRREYIVVNETGSALTISTYKDFAGANSTAIPANNSITLQSNGTNWYRIR